MKPLMFALVLVSSGTPSRGEMPIISQASERTASISGRVVDADSGAPLDGVRVGSRTLGWSVTDSQGRYIVRGVRDGRYMIEVPSEFIAQAEVPPAYVVVSGTRDVPGVDFRARLYGNVSGRVMDDDDKPINGATVVAVTLELTVAGVIGNEQEFAVGSESLHQVGSVGRSDDRGRFSIQGIRAGTTFYVLAYIGQHRHQPIANVLPAPSMRRKVMRATYFPSSDSLNAAAPLKLTSFEVRDGVDIVMHASPGLCITATLLREGTPGSVSYSLQESDVYRLGGEGLRIAPDSATGRSGADGRIKLCEVPPGRVFLSVAEEFPRPAYPAADLGVAAIDVVDKDIEGIVVSTRRPVAVVGEFEWADRDRTNEQPPIPTVETMPRSHEPGVVPRTNPFTLQLIPNAKYALLMSDLPVPYYVSDILLETPGGTSSVRNTALSVGEQAARLRVIIGSGARTVTVQVTDADHRNGRVFVMLWPAEAYSEEALAAGLIAGLANETGTYVSPGLRPGKYLLLATTDPVPSTIRMPQGRVNVDRTRDTLSLLLQARGRCLAIDLTSASNLSVKIDPFPIR